MSPDIQKLIPTLAGNVLLPGISKSLSSVNRREARGTRVKPGLRDPADV